MWGGLLGAVKKKQEESAESLSMVDSLRRLEALLDKLDHGNMMQRVPRSPARELEHVLGALNPIELGLIEPFRRFEQGVAKVEKELMRRDTVNENKLVKIRAMITQLLEKGQFGTLPPLEREPPPPPPCWRLRRPLPTPRPLPSRRASATTTTSTTTTAICSTRR